MSDHAHIKQTVMVWVCIGRRTENGDNQILCGADGKYIAFPGVGAAQQYAAVEGLENVVYLPVEGEDDDS